MPPYSSPISFARAARAIARPFLLSRIGILGAGLAAAIFIGYDPPPNPSAAWRVAPDPLWNLLARWDAFWYLDIASNGYRWNGNPLEQQNVVFFPLLPLVMRTAGAALGGHPLIAGLAVSLAAFAGALAYLWRWTAERRGEAAASMTVALICAYPFAVFYSAVYTESLFLLAIVGAWYHAERRELWTASLFGLAAGLLRPNGFLLAAPLAWILFVDPRFRETPLPRRIFPVVAPIAGMFVYSAYLALHVGDAFAWIAGQEAWPTIAPWARSVARASGSAPAPDLSVVAVHVANAAALVLAAIALRPTVRLLGVAAGMLIFLNLAPAVARHGLQSLGRFTSVLFPIFVWLADVVPAPHRRLVVAAFAAAQIAAATLFFTWRPLV